MHFRVLLHCAVHRRRVRVGGDAMRTSEAKWIGVFDRCTYIQMIAMRFYPCDAYSQRMSARSGFSRIPGDAYTFFYIPMNGECAYNANDLKDQYTLGTAARHIESHWGEIESGDTVDAEFLRGESKEPKCFFDQFPPEVYRE